MPLPVTFATLTQGNQPLSLIDQQFTAIGALVHIPCTAAGQNAVVLTPLANTPTVAGYTNMTPVFIWVQPQTSTGPVTIAIAGLAALNAYGSNGGVALSSGDLTAGNTYQCSYSPGLNSGAGGFVVNSQTPVTSQGNWTPGLAGDSVAGTPVYFAQSGDYEQIGRQVTARFFLQSSALTGIVGNLLITGLPLTVGSSTNGHCIMSYFTGWTPAAGYSYLGGISDPGTTFVKLTDSGPGVTLRQSPVGAFAAATTLFGLVNYHV